MRGLLRKPVGGVLSAASVGQATGPVVGLVSRPVIQPTATLTSPVDGAVVNQGTVALTATGTGTIAFMEFWADGVQLGTDSTAPYSFTWDASALSGSHQVAAVANDGFGTPGVLDGVHRVASNVATITVNVPIVNTALPAITTDGTPAVNETVSVSNGTWSGSPTGFAYQWRRAGVDIAGATLNTYTLQAADAGVAVTCRVTASDAIGSASATSASITPAAASASAPAIPTGLAATPSSSGTPQVVLTWNANASGDNVDVYQVYRDTSSTGQFPAVNTTVSGTTFTDTGVVGGGTYYYRVSAHNAAAGYGAWTVTPVSATPAAGGGTGLSAAIPAGANVGGISWFNDYEQASPWQKEDNPSPGTNWLQKVLRGGVDNSTGCQDDQITVASCASFGIPAPPGVSQGTAKKVVRWSVTQAQFDHWWSVPNANYTGNYGYPHAKCYTIWGPAGGGWANPEMIGAGAESGAYRSWMFIPTDHPRDPPGEPTLFSNVFQWKTDGDRIPGTVDILPNTAGFYMCFNGWIAGSSALGSAQAPEISSLLGTWFELKAVINHNASTIAFYLNGVLKYTRTGVNLKSTSERTWTFGRGHYAGLGALYTTNASFVPNGT